MKAPSRRCPSIGARARRLIGCALACAVILAAAAHGQNDSQPPGRNATVPAQPSNGNGEGAIPLAEVATEAEAATARLRELRGERSADEEVSAIGKQLSGATRELDARVRETRRILAQRPSLETLARIEPEWRRLRANLSAWTRELVRHVLRLDGEVTELDRLAHIWKQTLAAAELSRAPADILQRIQEVLIEIRDTRAVLESERGRALTIQNRVALQDGRIADALTMIKQAREDVASRLFVRDSPAIWNAESGSRAPQHLEEESRSSFAVHWAGLRRYAERQPGRFILYGLLLAGLVAVLASGRKRLRRYIEREPGLAPAARLLEAPLAGAFILSFLFSFSIYLQAPRLLWSALGASALIPSVIILRPVIKGWLHPLLYALVVLYCVDQVRGATAAVEFIPRLLLLAEMLGAALFLVWLIRVLTSAAPAEFASERERDHVKYAAGVGAVIAALGFFANALGYVSLATLIADALLGSAYFAVLLAAVVGIADGLAAVAMCLKPFTLLRLVRRHRVLLRRRLRRGFELLAFFFWLAFVLDRLLIRESLLTGLREIVTAELSVGALRVSLGDLLAFVGTVWAALLISRFVSFLLQEDVYPRVHLTRGLPYAISTLAHYLVLLVGFFVAMAALGLDMTKITILAGAFSVGVGLGLQSIFNNFVSGLILLFERPVNVGDMVQIDDALGMVEHIGIRASIIRTDKGSDIIVPNGKLISDKLINYTLSSRRRGIELQIGVAQEADPARVIALLENTAAAHPLITSDPPPRALVVRLGSDALGLELRAWTERVEDWREIQSELAMAIRTALTAEKIPIR